MRQLETNLNFISSLPDDPAIMTSELKQEFDKAGNTIKGYINDILLPDITNADENTATSVMNQVRAAIDDFENEIESTINDFKNQVNGSLSSMQDTISNMSGSVNSKVSYGDFAITTGNRSDNLAGNTTSIEYNLDCTITKEGYFPIGIVGFHYLKTDVDSELLRYELTSRANGRAVVTYKLKLNNTRQTTTHTVYFNILWVKIR